MKGDEFITRLVAGYHSLSVLHRGRRAVVYHALRDDTDEPAALKVLRLDEPLPPPVGDAEREATLRLSAHPHIVALHGTGVTTTGRPYVAMDYCLDGSYADILVDRGPLPVDEAVEAARAVAEALAAAHAEGLLHGAVTPTNVLRGESGPMLADFPMCRAPEEVSGGALTGAALHHAAPELLQGHPATPASDLYGLAATLWTLLAGHAPFADPGTEPEFFAYRERVLAEPAPPVPAPGVPTSLQQLLARALAKDPAERPTDAAEFAASLAAVDTRTLPASGPVPTAAPVPTPVTPPPPTPPAAPPARPPAGPPAGPPVVEEHRPGWSFFDAQPDLAPPTPAWPDAPDEPPAHSGPTYATGPQQHTPILEPPDPVHTAAPGHGEEQHAPPYDIEPTFVPAHDDAAHEQSWPAPVHEAAPAPEYAVEDVPGPDYAVGPSEYPDSPVYDVAPSTTPPADPRRNEIDRPEYPMEGVPGPTYDIGPSEYRPEEVPGPDYALGTGEPPAPDYNIGYPAPRNAPGETYDGYPEPPNTPAPAYDVAPTELRNASGGTYDGYPEPANTPGPAYDVAYAEPTSTIGPAYDAAYPEPRNASGETYDGYSEPANTSGPAYDVAPTERANLPGPAYDVGYTDPRRASGDTYDGYPEPANTSGPAYDVAYAEPADTGGPVYDVGLDDGGIDYRVGGEQRPEFVEPDLGDGPIPPGHRGPRVKPMYPRGRRSAYVGAVVAGSVLGMVAVVLLAMGGGSGGGETAGPVRATPAPAGTLIKPRGDWPHTPEQVRITDRRVVAALTWRDRSGGKAAHYVVGGPTGKTPTTLAEVPVGGQARTEISGLNPTVNYCFTVVAILGVDEVAAAAPVCTRRRV